MKPFPDSAIELMTCDGQMVRVPLFSLAQAHARMQKRPPGSIDQIQAAVCKYFGLKQTDLRSHRRQKHLCEARHIAIFLARELTEYSLLQIGRCFGGRDHTTVLHAIRKVDAKSAWDANLRAELDLLRSVIAAGELAA